ncbi:MAG: nucleotide exchange factor GrpE [Verrucomicrobia bacterium]|nr:nucleotide exchange factor GrpE [Verrucomicrobiota bacterium]
MTDPQIESEEETIDYKDKYLRQLAETENMRRRMQKERQEMTRFAVESILSEFLTPIDNFENALKMTETLSDELRTWAQGFQMLLGQFKDVLSANGITPFSSEGMRFDPALHDAIETEETSEEKAGTVLKEYVKGYRCGDRTVRPARVKVGVATQTTENKTGE